jgi:hypothetical protein
VSRQQVRDLHLAVQDMLGHNPLAQGEKPQHGSHAITIRSCGESPKQGGKRGSSHGPRIPPNFKALPAISSFHSELVADTIPFDPSCLLAAVERRSR